MKNTRFSYATSILFLLLIVLTHPADAVIGAIEDGLVAYWSFDKDTVQIAKQAEDIFLV